MGVEQVSGIALEHKLHPEKSDHDNLVTQMHMVNFKARSWKSHSCRVVYALLMYLHQGEVFESIFSSFSSTRGNAIQLCLNSFYHFTHISIQTK